MEVFCVISFSSFTNNTGILPSVVRPKFVPPPPLGVLVQSNPPLNPRISFWSLKKEYQAHLFYLVFMKINDQKALIYTKEGELSAYFSKFIERFASEFKETSFSPEQLEVYVESILKEQDRCFKEKQTIKLAVKIAKLPEDLKAQVGPFHYEILELIR